MIKLLAKPSMQMEDRIECKAKQSIGTNQKNQKAAETIFCPSTTNHALE